MYRYLSEITMIVNCSFVLNQPLPNYVVTYFAPAPDSLTRILP